MPGTRCSVPDAIRRSPARLRAAAPLRRRLGVTRAAGKRSHVGCSLVTGRALGSRGRPPSLPRRGARRRAGAARPPGAAPPPPARRAAASGELAPLPPSSGAPGRGGGRRPASWAPRRGRRFLLAPPAVVAPLRAQHGQQAAAAGAAARLQPRRAGRGLRLRAEQLRRHPRPAARLPAAPAVPLPGRRGRRRWVRGGGGTAGPGGAGSLGKGRGPWPVPSAGSVRPGAAARLLRGNTSGRKRPGATRDAPCLASFFSGPLRFLWRAAARFLTGSASPGRSGRR